MKKTILFFYLLFFFAINSFAQNWVNGGNNLAADGTIGINTNFNLLFETGGVERGRVTNVGLWGLGTIAPNSRLHVNSLGGQNPFRVEVAGNTRLLVHSAGGVSIGSATAPPALGLYVFGNTGIGTATPSVKLHVLGGNEASLAGGGFIGTGSLGSLNLGIDNNEIQARNNGAYSPLYLNNDGGNVIMNGIADNASNVAIGTTAPSSDLHILHTNGYLSNGLTIEDNYSAGLSWNIYSATTSELWLSHDGAHVGSFNGTSGAYTALSDKRAKKDIASMGNVLERVMKLKPSTYHFNNQKATSDRKFLGLIAQDVQEVFPEAVYTHNGKLDGADDFLTLDYSVFGIIAIKAIQEQQGKIDALQTQLVAMDAKIKALSSQLNNPETKTGVILEQNLPNPFNQTTTFKYKIPKGSSGEILIYNTADASLVKTISATDSGEAFLNAQELKSGTYLYLLLVNGQVTESKKMILQD